MIAKSGCNGFVVLLAYNRLVHAGNKIVDELLTVASITSLSEVSKLLNKTASGASELEGPEEAGSLTEVGSRGEDLVNDILNADKTELTERGLDDGVISDGNALLINDGVSALVDELADSLESGVSPGDVRLDDTEHLKDGLGQTDEDTVVQLTEAQKLQDLAGLGADVVDTTDTDDESDLGLRLDEKLSSVLGIAASLDELQLASAVLLGVGLGALEDDLTGLLVLLHSRSTSRLLVGELLGLNLLSLEDRLGDRAIHHTEAHQRSLDFILWAKTGSTFLVFLRLSLILISF